MITKVEVFSQQPGAPELPLGGFMPNDDPIQIKNIEGLGPVKASIVTTEFATGRGELFQGATTGKRNIVMTLGLNPDYVEFQTMATLRQALYRYLLPEQWTKLRFFSDELPPVDIEGHVESLEPNIFSQDPEVQVSVICPKPDFIDADATIITGVVDDGTIETEFEYIGTIPTGFELRIDAIPANPSYTGSIELGLGQEGTPQQVFEVDTVVIDATKYFKVSTVKSGKRVETILIADESRTNLLAEVSDVSVWPEIKPGLNILQVIAAETGQGWTLAYLNRFGGL